MLAKSRLARDLVLLGLPLCALVGTGVSLVPAEASACGGTFCDLGPLAMPVDQTGENILFVIDGATTEAHIQIQYDPNTAAKFAWVVPVLSLPTFEVGSERLFDNVLAATVPTYGFSYQFDDCGNGSVTNSTSSPGSGSDTAADDSTGTGGPEIVLQQTVGAFEITVLQGGTAEEVMAWLGENEYEQDPDAEPILAEYLAENYLFAAFKLTNEADLDEIHPIVLKFDGDEACVPLRLTRIAAVEDMDVRAFFLADARVVPQNYRHVLVNPLRLDWPGLAANYKEIITLAVDAFEADGKAFVTEYAGPSSAVQPGGIHSDAWDPTAFVDMPVIDVIDALGSQGLVSCYDGGGESGGDGTQCQYEHALLRGLLANYLPVPDGLDEVQFYGCLTCYEDQIDLVAWGDGSGFAADMQTRIVEPGAHAAELLSAYPVLTRMYTTISPAEMTDDPFFWPNPDLPMVDLTNAIATRRVLCNGDAVWTLPDGHEVYVPNDGPWPDFSDEMPWVEEIAEMPKSGAPLALVDNRTLIASELQTYNCGYSWPNPDACGGASGSATGSGSDDSTSDTAGEDEVGRGCGCRSDAGGSTALGVLALLAMIGRRRARH
jgi:MYXO-CTERM domain-containing protein